MCVSPTSRLISEAMIATHVIKLHLYPGNFLSISASEAQIY